MLAERIDYLLNGHALDELEARLGRRPPNLDLLLREAVGSASETDQILRHFLLHRAPSGTTLRDAVDESLQARSAFRLLGCRGFSYALSTSFDFTDRLQKSTNLRFMLMAEEDLFYPPRIKRYLQHATSFHCRRSNGISIAFALGREIRDCWYVFVLQSDLCFRPSYVREHFRGWQRVLISHVLQAAERAGARLRLIAAEEIPATCYPRWMAPESLPPIWRAIYDGTAAWFGLAPIRVEHGVNARVAAAGHTCKVHQFFETPSQKRVHHERTRPASSILRGDHGVHDDPLPSPPA